MKASEPMKPVRGLLCACCDQMLGAAEADFQAHLVGAFANSARRSAGAGLVEIERETRQQRVEQRRLPRLERMALAPAEEGALRRW